MNAPLPSCCEYHADQLPTGCQQGTLCPDRARESDEAADHASAPVTAESTQLQFGDIAIGIAVGLVVAFGFAAAYFS